MGRMFISELLFVVDVVVVVLNFNFFWGGGGWLFVFLLSPGSLRWTTRVLNFPLKT